MNHVDNASEAKAFSTTNSQKKTVVSMPPKFQMFKDAAEKFRFRVLAENGEIVAASEAYEAYANCIKGINSVKKNCDSEIEDLTINDRKVLHPKYQIFKDAAEKYRFHLKASNGEIIAASEGYQTKDSALTGINVVKRSGNAEIDDSAIIGMTMEEPVVSSEVKQRAKSTRAKMAKTTTSVPEVKLPEVGVPEVKLPEVGVPEAKADVSLPKAETKDGLFQTVSVQPVGVGVSKVKGDLVEAKPKGVSVLKELLISFVGLVIALVLSALALGIANWGIGFFGITGDWARAAAIVAVAIVIGPTIAAFATKKYF